MEMRIVCVHDDPIAIRRRHLTRVMLVARLWVGEFFTVVGGRGIASGRARAPLPNRHGGLKRLGRQAQGRRPVRQPHKKREVLRTGANRAGDRSFEVEKESRLEKAGAAWVRVLIRQGYAWEGCVRSRITDGRHR